MSGRQGESPLMRCPPPEEVSRTPYHCPECGATYNTDETCEDRFNASQAQELADPAYYAVHHFSVPCFMLQHNRYSQDGWIRVRQLLTRFLRGLTPQEARNKYRTAVDSRNRTYSFTRGPKLAGVDAIAWTRTIADVRLDTAEKRFNQQLTDKIEALGYRVFLPQRDGVERGRSPYDAMPPDERRRLRFALDKDNVLSCDVFLFVLD